MSGRRRFLAQAACAGAWMVPLDSRLGAQDQTGVLLNDVQSRLNATRVWRVFRPDSLDRIQAVVRASRDSGRAISVAGGRHSMGGQQFGQDNLHVDMTGFSRVLELDEQRGQVTVEAGIQWPQLIEELHRRQPGTEQPWTIREKQTGVDAVTLAGSLSSNVHGRSLRAGPIVGDVESFRLVDAEGAVKTCSRSENAELFSLAVGGYGLLGIITHVTLRLVRRYKVRRRVEAIQVKDLLDWHRRRISEGFVFGDCQYSGDLRGPAESHPGVFPCYEPVPLATPLTSEPKSLSGEQWAELYRLMRTNKREAFERYAAHYRQTDGQVYWSDTHQLAGNFLGHRAAVNPERGTEMITEGYLRHDKLMPFFEAVRRDLVERQADIMYGTIRFIEADRETFLPWAKERSVCVVCNLHVQHTDEGIAKAKADFSQLIDRAIEFDGSFYLAYHRWATPQQMAACYPKLRDFFRLKRKYDPGERFQSEWYRHYAPHFT
jgi:hypothetical protein